MKLTVSTAQPLPVPDAQIPSRSAITPVFVTMVSTKIIILALLVLIIVSTVPQELIVSNATVLIISMKHRCSVFSVQLDTS